MFSISTWVTGLSCEEKVHPVIVGIIPNMAISEYQSMTNERFVVTCAMVS